MTPKEFFKAKGYGSLRDCANHIGFCEAYIWAMINIKRQPSLFFIQCLNDYCGTRFTELDFKTGPRRKTAFGSVTEQYRSEAKKVWQVTFGKKFIGRADTEAKGIELLNKYKESLRLTEKP